MKRILSVITLFLVLVGSVFATDLVKVFVYETEEMETIDVYFDLDSTEPFDIKNESIEHFLLLQEFNEEVEVCLENIEDEDWKPLWDLAVECNCYNIFMESEDFCVDMYINNNDTVTVYSYRLIKNQAEEQ